MTALANGTAYYFRVAAINDFEAVGPMSNETSATPATPIDPGAPTGLTARAGDAQVTLSWTAPASNGGPQVTSYNVYDGTTADFKAGILVKSSTSTGATVTGLANGTTYYFWVTAVNAVGESPASNEASAAPAANVPPADPGAPTGLTARAGDAQVTLSWTAPASNGGPQVTSYNVYDGTTADFKAGILVKSSTSTGATVTGLANGTTYYFWVTAVNAVGESPASNEASAAPAANVPPADPGAPTGLTARAGDAQVTLSWTAPASNGGPQVTSYNVYDGTTADFKAGILVKSSTSTGATVTGLANGTTYYFWVTAVNAVGESPASNEASAAPAANVPPADPGAPTGLTARAGDAQVTLSWTAPASNGGPQVTSYNVYDGTTADLKAGTLVKSSTSTGATVTGLANGTTYYFWVTAINIAGHESPSSAEVSARPETAAEVKLTSGSVPKELIAALAAIATVAVAGALTLAMRGKRLNSRSPRHVTPASDVRAVPGPRLPDAVNVRETGREPTHTVRFEPDRGTTITTIKEKP